MIANRIECWLLSQAKTPHLGDYRCELFAADNVERITFWNEFNLGPAPTEEQLASVVIPDAALQAQAKAAFNVSDMTALRCWKRGISFPVEWVSYEDALRGIIKTGTGTIPARPAFPAGT